MVRLKWLYRSLNMYNVHKHDYSCHHVTKYGYRPSGYSNLDVALCNWVLISNSFAVLEKIIEITCVYRGFFHLFCHHLRSALKYTSATAAGCKPKREGRTVFISDVNCLIVD